MRIRTLWSASLLAPAALLTAFALSGEEARGVPPAHPAPPSDPSVGRALFIAHNCYGCHGGLAGGGMGPSLRDVTKKKPVEKVHQIIMTGKPHMGMPKWEKMGMTSDEAWYIVSYLQTLGEPNEPDFFIGWKEHIPPDVKVHVLQSAAQQEVKPKGPTGRDEGTQGSARVKQKHVPIHKGSG